MIIIKNWYLLSRDNLWIALSKYGMVRFYLVILDYTDSKSILYCEQKWTDLLKSEYSINPIAGNIKGYKHSIESKEKKRIAFLDRKHTEAVKQIMSNSCKGVNYPLFWVKSIVINHGLLLKLLHLIEKVYLLVA